MPHIRFKPADITVEASEGASLLEAARRAGYILQSECGGQGICRRCKVRLIEGDVFISGEQNLTAAEQDENIVLACIARVVDDAEIEIPQESELKLTAAELKPELTPGEHPGKEIESLGLRVNPAVSRVKITIPDPTLQNNASDFDRVVATLQKAGVDSPFHADLKILQTLPRVTASSKGGLDLLIHSQADSNHILSFDMGCDPIYGLALDIGTTTLFARLIDLNSGEVAEEASDYNSQIPCGGDIIHRIVYAAKPDGLKHLRDLVIGTANSLIDELLKKADISADQMVACTLAGNTTMQHLFLGLDPKTIREEPYVPIITHFPQLTAAETELNILPNAPVYMTPSVASYVGGDITAGLLAAGVHRSDKLTLYVDLGTNGEIALGNSDWLTACACSAGPAFEGSGVKCGTRAVSGGIDRVQLNAVGQLEFSTIGGGSPCGICGSGMIDLLTQLRATRRITARGKFNREADPQRIRKIGTKSEIVLVRGTEEKSSADIVVTEPDLDNLIRTKGAIFAGIMTLLKGVGLKASEIERVVIAGSFGRYLDIENAIRIGMLPDLPLERFEYIGNGSLRGAGLALLSRKLWEELEEISRMITYFELSSWQGYMDEFMASLFLPHTDLSLFPSVK